MKTHNPSFTPPRVTAKRIAAFTPDQTYSLPYIEEVFGYSDLNKSQGAELINLLSHRLIFIKVPNTSSYLYKGAVQKTTSASTSQTSSTHKQGPSYISCIRHKLEPHINKHPDHYYRAKQLIEMVYGKPCTDLEFLQLIEVEDLVSLHLDPNALTMIEKTLNYVFFTEVTHWIQAFTTVSYSEVTVRYIMKDQDTYREANEIEEGVIKRFYKSMGNKHTLDGINAIKFKINAAIRWIFSDSSASYSGKQYNIQFNNEPKLDPSADINYTIVYHLHTQLLNRLQSTIDSLNKKPHWLTPNVVTQMFYALDIYCDTLLKFMDNNKK